MNIPSTTTSPSTTLGRNLAVVAIGRNEGARLRACLHSLVGKAAAIVYVDSGSTDGSVEMAKALGVHVVDLDMSKPFTAARARNAGFARALEVAPHVTLIQFVDGDTEVAPGWLAAAERFLDANPKAGAVLGRRRERFPETTDYNLLCDIEWNIKPGVVKYFGGDVMIRRAIVEAIKGYNPDIIAAEDSELSVRVRKAGWTIHCLAEEMTLHDAALKTFKQWWVRTMRGGFGFAEGTWRHGAPPERHFVRETRRIWAWGVVIPLLTLSLALLVSPLFLALLLVYPLQIVRLFFKYQGTPKMRWVQALYLTLARFPETVGLTKFHYRRLMGHSAAIIEYK
jgi:glycosyltransferase involved in cell wall biosynthesis